MFAHIESKETLTTPQTIENSSDIFDNELKESLFEEETNEYENSEFTDNKKLPIKDTKKTISVGDSLPYGIRLHYGTSENIVRMKDIGVRKRILVLGVIGSFTPYCWNRHLFRVLQKSTYYEERYIDYICCVSTNDAYTQTAWASYLGCEETVLMLADTTTRYTKAIGMDVVIPWLDNNIRSKRYIIYAEDMIVIKMLVASKDGPRLRWECEHLEKEKEVDDEELTSDTDPWNII